MTDEELKLEEIETSHTLGGSDTTPFSLYMFIITDKARARRGGR